MTKVSRREFARDVMLLAAAAAVMPSVIAQAPDKPPALSAASQAEVDARVQWIVAKYGARLNDEQRADIRRIITGGQAGVETMRKYDLANAAGPAEPFRIYRRAAKR
ncbi:MAG TPA: hypothetical protein VGK31_05330 [Thermoanaerobaculia bacterium]|jgi:hypothetical protein